MRRRMPDVTRLSGVVAIALVGLCLCAPHALAQRTLNLSAGYSMARDQRVATDILLIEHHDLLFDVSNFNSWTIGGEWLVPLGDFVEAGCSFARLRWR
jgi:hypothetical protein